MTSQLSNEECDRILNFATEEKLPIRQFLMNLLLKLCQEKECFSSKRPFGNSDWEYDLHQPLITNGVVEGETDELGHVVIYDKDKADAVIQQLIHRVFEKPES